MTKTAKITFKPRRALISVSDKSQLASIAKALQKHGVEIIATGNTANRLREQDIAVKDVSEITGFPEMMDGRVKTLHPAIHGAILARGEQDEACLEQQNISPIDIVIVNLYPFEQTISDPDCDFSKAIENIDIGGPCMIRAAAKNYEHCHVIVSPEDYATLQHCLKTGKVESDWSFQLAKKAFAHTAAYDAAISNYLGTLDNQFRPSCFPPTLTRQFIKQDHPLRYGENPHQQAIFYRERKPGPGALSMAVLHQGKPLSYNNLLDADAAYNCIKEFQAHQPACVIVKHNNPCGIAIARETVNAYLRAFQADPQSAFGGIIAFNQPVDDNTAKTILDNQFVEVILAPSFTKAALDIFSSKENIRILETGSLPSANRRSMDLRQIDGGMLVQEHDSAEITIDDLQIVTEAVPDEALLDDLLFAWRVVKHVKSNAIVYAQNKATLGIGAGQSSRVMSARIGLMLAEQYGFSVDGAVMASDAFLPFPDTLEIAADAGIRALIQPGGSIRDQQIIDCANERGICMVFTGIRHFKH